MSKRSSESMDPKRKDSSDTSSKTTLSFTEQLEVFTKAYEDAYDLPIEEITAQFEDDEKEMEILKRQTPYQAIGKLLRAMQACTKVPDRRKTKLMKTFIPWSNL